MDLFLITLQHFLKKNVLNGIFSFLCMHGLMKLYKDKFLCMVLIQYKYFTLSRM